MRKPRKSPELLALEEHVRIIVGHHWVGDAGIEEACARTAKALGMTPRRVKGLLYGEAVRTDDAEVERVKKALRDRYLVSWVKRQTAEFVTLSEWSGGKRRDFIAEARDALGVAA